MKERVGVASLVVTVGIGYLALRAARRVQRAVAWWWWTLLYGYERPDVWEPQVAEAPAEEAVSEHPTFDLQRPRSAH